MIVTYTAETTKADMLVTRIQDPGTAMVEIPTLIVNLKMKTLLNFAML